MFYLIKLLVTAFVVITLSYLFPNIEVTSYWSALLFAFILSVLNVLVKPVFALLTLPITVFTLGFFLLVLNALMLLLASYFVDGVVIGSFATAFWSALILTCTGMILTLLKKSD